MQVCSMKFLGEIRCGCVMTMVEDRQIRDNNHCLWKIGFSITYINCKPAY